MFLPTPNQKPNERAKAKPCHAKKVDDDDDDRDVIL
jgi:hypothetical protein